MSLFSRKGQVAQGTSGEAFEPLRTFVSSWSHTA